MVERPGARDDGQPVARGPGTNLGDALAVEAVEVAMDRNRRTRTEDVLDGLEEGNRRRGRITWPARRRDDREQTFGVMIQVLEFERAV